jgi:hypothetical protein
MKFRWEKDIAECANIAEFAHFAEFANIAEFSYIAEFFWLKARRHWASPCIMIAFKAMTTIFTINEKKPAS